MLLFTTVDYRMMAKSVGLVFYLNLLFVICIVRSVGKAPNPVLYRKCFLIFFVKKNLTPLPRLNYSLLSELSITHRQLYLYGVFPLR
jgi:hypothetical protein